MKNNAFLLGFISAGAVFILGFGVMFLLYQSWNIHNPNSELNGLFDYTASAYGDSICLPLLLGALVYSFFEKNSHPIVIGKISIVIAVVSFLSSCIIQASWLINDHTPLNWSLPKQHHFNIAGWYHAFFFVAMVTLLMMFLSEYILYSKRMPGYVLDIIVFFAFSLFFYFHYLDDYFTPDKPMSSLAIAFIICISLQLIIKGLQLFALREKSIMQLITPLFCNVLSLIIIILMIAFTTRIKSNL
ncbi:MAG: hypothetical protein IJM51_02675 [Clostridia bacterium]|nr:hypothetical protein [Clostridia bacterium]